MHEHDRASKEKIDEGRDGSYHCGENKELIKNIAAARLADARRSQHHLHQPELDHDEADYKKGRNSQEPRKIHGGDNLALVDHIAAHSGSMAQSSTIRHNVPYRKYIVRLR